MLPSLRFGEEGRWGGRSPESGACGCSVFAVADLHLNSLRSVVVLHLGQTNLRLSTFEPERVEESVHLNTIWKEDLHELLPRR